MERVVEFVKGLFGVLALCGVLFLGIEAIDGPPTTLRPQSAAAQAAQRSERMDQATPGADYFPSHYTNRAKEVEELPAQF